MRYDRSIRHADKDVSIHELRISGHFDAHHEKSLIRLRLTAEIE